tara:strand:- start:771 stop:1289 length:519 start_codon:yes stop_codon:yes gene_type:complete
MYRKFISKIKNHNKIKNKLLGLINKSPSGQINSFFEKTNKTDYDIKMKDKPYVKELVSHIRPIMNDLAKQFKAKHWEIHHMWCQSYLKGDYHKWHTHPLSHFAHIYYLELPTNKMATEFKDGEVVKVKEGDVISFPAFLFHRSKPNISNKRKTAVSFNSSIFWYHKYKEENK